MGYKILSVRKIDKPANGCCSRNLGLWNALIPKGDSLVARAMQSLSSKVAHYTERARQK